MKQIFLIKLLSINRCDDYSFLVPPLQLEDQKAGGLPMHKTVVPEGHIIITGIVGEQWSVGDRKQFMSKYDRITTASEGDHGTCFAKAPAQRCAIRMKHPFAVYPAWDATHPQLGQSGYYLLQYSRGSSDYGPVEADIFDRTYSRLRT